MASYPEPPTPPTSEATSFPGWKAALASARLRPELRWRFTTEISRFLRYCQILHAPVTVPRSREYLAIVPLPAARPEAREALRWYFATARAVARALFHPHAAGRSRRGGAGRRLDARRTA